MLTCGLVRSNFALATVGSSCCCHFDSLILLDSRGSGQMGPGSLGAGGPVARRDHSPRTFLTISSAMPAGTSAYESNSIEYDAWPEVLDLRSPTYPNISESGTSALLTISPWICSSALI